MMVRSISKVTLTIAGICILLVTQSANAFAETKYTRSESHSDLGFKGLGPRLGFVDPQGGLDATAEVGVVFDFGNFTPKLKWDGSLSYWSAGRNYRYFNGNRYDSYDWSVSDVILRTGVNYRFVEGEWVPFAGGGLAMHFYSWDYNNAPFYNNSSDSKVGIYLDGGIERQFNLDWTGQLQVQADISSPDQTALLFNLIYRLR